MEETRKSEWIAEVLDQYQGSLIRYATWIVGDLDAAREIVQETFLRLCRQDPSKVAAYVAQWLFTVCRNLALDARRKETRMTPLGDIEVAVASNLEEKHTVNEIFRLIETLPKNQREVVYLKFQCDLSYKEISEVTQLSVSNIGFLLHTALRNLRKQMLSPARRTQ